MWSKREGHFWQLLHNLELHISRFLQVRLITLIKFVWDHVSCPGRRCRIFLLVSHSWFVSLGSISSGIVVCFYVCTKFCEWMQELLHYRFLQSLKQKPLPRPCKSLNVEFQSSINSSLLSPFPDEINTGKILACLHLHKNPSMLWQLCHVNKAWHAFVSQGLERQALEVVKSENPSYHQTVKQLHLKRCSFKERL